jgi:lipoyl(octanoyl) transferase
MSYTVNFTDLGLKDYKETWDYQELLFRKIIDAKISGLIIPGTLIFVEHPHVYTLGKSGSENNLLINYLQLQAAEAKFYHIDRGGDITYHGPGQIVGYPIFDLESLNIGLREYITRLEEAIILTCADFGITASRLQGGTGVWIDPEVSGRARKICAIGVRASRYVTMHGFAFNVNTDLSWFNNINPCGFTDKGVTSLEKELAGKQDFGYIKNLTKKHLKEVFGLDFLN